MEVTFYSSCCFVLYKGYTGPANQSRLLDVKVVGRSYRLPLATGGLKLVY